MKHYMLRLSFQALTMASLCMSGCQRQPLDNASDQPPLVVVSNALRREVTDFVDFTGRTEAPQSVDIRTRVTGYLLKMPFEEGTDVKAGDLLFEIDPRPYQAELDRAQGDVDLNKAKLKLAIADNLRAKGIYEDDPGAISKQDVDKSQAEEEEANAAVKASQANLEGYKINLEFTKVTSPIDGKVGRYLFAVGNLVNQDNTLLTTVVSQDPMYAYFDVDERTMLHVVRTLLRAKDNPLKEKKITVMIGLADEDGFPHVGYIDFANNVVDPSTGTITSRGVFDNPASESGARLLRPGMFVRVRLPLGKPYQGVLVADKALGSDQGQKYLLVVDDKNTVQYRRVQTGPLQEDGLRVIAEGLQTGERVIISGLQMVQAQMEVEVHEEPMPVRPVPRQISGPVPNKDALPAPDSK